MEVPQISLPMGKWGNIGNAFFQLGIKYALDNATDQANVIGVPTEDCGLVGSSGSPDAIAYREIINGDMLVISGPIFSEGIFSKYSRILDHAITKDTKLLFLSSGCNQYTKKEIEIGREFMKNYEPHVFVSRDSETYGYFHDLAEHSYDGVDFAFFANDFYPGYELPELSPYICLIYDKIREPDLDLGSYSASDSNTYNTITTERKTEFPTLLKILSEYFREFPKEVDGYKVLRPDHQPLKRLRTLRSNKRNTFSTTVPYGYLNLYRNSRLTAGTRVHACVPTLSYGNPAMLQFETKRATLFDRVNCGEIRNKPCSVDMHYIEEEKEKMINFLSDTLP